MNFNIIENKTIAVDVDGTLINAFGDINQSVLKYCADRKAEGFFIILWSARGKKHAEAQAARGNALDLFDVIISKPGMILDDKGWTWTKHTRLVREL